MFLALPSLRCPFATFQISTVKLQLLVVYLNDRLLILIHILDCLQYALDMPHFNYTQIFQISPA